MTWTMGKIADHLRLVYVRLNRLRQLDKQLRILQSTALFESGNWNGKGRKNNGTIKGFPVIFWDGNAEVN